MMRYLWFCSSSFVVFSVAYWAPLLAGWVRVLLVISISMGNHMVNLLREIFPAGYTYLQWQCNCIMLPSHSDKGDD